MKTTTWWFAITGEDSDLCGEEFFVEVYTTLDKAKAEAIHMAERIFEGEQLICYGRVSQVEAEMMGLDTY